MIFVEAGVTYSDGRSSVFTAVLNRKPPISHVEIERALLQHAHEYPLQFSGGVVAFRVFSIAEQRGDVIILPALPGASKAPCGF